MSEAGPVLDFRSDTITRPTLAMREAMVSAELGDDCYGEDPSVNALEAKAAELLGKESGLFLPSGTQSNLSAIMAHCGRGDAYLVGDQAHIQNREMGGAAVLGSVQPIAVPNQSDGSLAFRDMTSVLHSHSRLMAPIKLLALENSFNGRVLPMEYLLEAEGFAKSHGMAMHLDGARIFNAATALGRPAAEIAAPFDSVSFCLSKGLGAPVGSLLVGGSDIIDAARRHRQILGGAMRQSGVLAAAGIYALDHHIARLAEDHRRAAHLAELLSGIPGIAVERTETNMVFAEPAPEFRDRFSNHLKQSGIRVTGTAARMRWVTHLDLDDDMLLQTEQRLSGFSS